MGRVNKSRAGVTGTIRSELLGSVEVQGLVRTYRRPIRGNGLGGAVRHIIRPSFEEVTAVDRIDLKIEAGESVGYVGPNGAGKSTTIKVLTGVIERTAGSVHVNGLDPSRHRTTNASYIGVVWGQRNLLWWDLPLRESFRALNIIYGRDSRRLDRHREDLVELLDLGDLMRVPVRQLSLGQRTRANICAALMHDPAIIFLDEPTIGLDVFVKERVRAALSEIRRARGTTLMVTSQDLTDVEQLCERLLILNHGRIVHDGPLAAATKRFATVRTLHVTTRGPADATHLDGRPGMSVRKPADTQLVVRFDEERHPAVSVVSEVLASYEVVDLALEPPSIEDVLRYLTGEANADAAAST